jgi:hypothetical protein
VRLEVVAALVGEVACRVVALCQGGFELDEEVRKVFKALGAEDFERVQVEVAGVVGCVEASCLEEDGVGVLGDERVDGLRKLMPRGQRVLQRRCVSTPIWAAPLSYFVAAW